jgi:hypothetical protein
VCVLVLAVSDVGEHEMEMDWKNIHGHIKTVLCVCIGASCIRCWEQEMEMD